MEKLTGAKRLHRKYKMQTDWRPSFEYEEVEVSVIEFNAELEAKLKEEYVAHQKELMRAKAKDTLDRVKKIETKEVKVAQRSHEWFKERAGVITGSDTPFDINGKPIPTFMKYVYKKVADAFKYEFIENHTEEDNVQTKAMEDGNLLEPLALERYAKKTGLEVQEKGIYRLDGYHIGASPDAVAYDENFNPRIIEIKNLQLNTYLNELMNPGTQEKKYKAQLQTEMLCSGIHTADFVIQSATMPERFELLIYKIDLDAEYLANMIDTIELFEIEFEKAYYTLKSRFK